MKIQDVFGSLFFKLLAGFLLFLYVVTVTLSKGKNFSKISKLSSLRVHPVGTPKTFPIAVKWLQCENYHLFLFNCKICNSYF